MIKVIRYPGKEPAIAYTDFQSVYLSDLLGKPQTQAYRTAHKHECGHIWLQHLPRRLAFEATLAEPLHADTWNIAADCEIAWHLYDADDEAEIAAPRSRLRGGITRVHAQPAIDAGCEPYAEHIYVWLVQQQQGQQQGQQQQQQQQGQQQGQQQQQQQGQQQQQQQQGQQQGQQQQGQQQQQRQQQQQQQRQQRQQRRQPQRQQALLCRGAHGAATASG